MATVKDFSVEEKLVSLVTLQKIESKIDEFQILKGELPIEVSDLEDEIQGLTARQTRGRVHRDGSDGVPAQVLGDFEHQTGTVVGGLERVQDRREVVVELNVDDGTHHLTNTTDLVVSHRFVL